MTVRSPSAHIPVLLDRVVRALAPVAGEAHIDATFGGGGYSAALLRSADCRVLALDRDPAALRRGRAMADRFPGRLILVEGRFSRLDDIAAEAGMAPVDGVVFDLGVSTSQLDDAERGFSFLADGPLDMRMDTRGPDAAWAVNGLAEDRLAEIISSFGEERRARAVARAIAAARRRRPIRRSRELADIVRGVVRRSADGIDPATRTFQALRLWVNDELGELQRALPAAERVLRGGGRLVVVAFHSLEDRIVKRFLTERSGAAPRPNRHLPGLLPAGREATFTVATRRPLRPDAQEILRNPRCRPARLRSAVRTAAPAWTLAA